jgi:hypothetical protein
MFLVKIEIIKVMGARRPCQIPFQNPAIFPSLFGVFSASFGPGTQLEKTRIKIRKSPR